MTVTLLVSAFQFMMACQRGVTVVTLSGDEVGVYARGIRNDFRTPLVARGPRAEVEARIAREVEKA